MSVYNDMANDAGYSYGSYENQQMAQMDAELQEEHEAYITEEYEKDMKHREILSRKFTK